MKLKTSGKLAEETAAAYLEGRGWEVLEQNWRRPRCEIDIVAKKGDVIYFVEVKFRSSELQGDGLSYITSKKLKQMDFAARLWNIESGWQGDWRLMAVSVEPTGTGLAVKDMVEIT